MAVALVVPDGTTTTFNFDSSSNPGWTTPAKAVTGADYAWTRQSGTTPSTQTGPSAGAGGGGAYWFVEASNPRKSGDLFGLAFDGSACSSSGGISSITFKYHMYGHTMGTLELMTAAGTMAWSKSTDQGNTVGSNGWQTSASVDINAASFYFKYTRASDYYGDVRAHRSLQCRAWPAWLACTAVHSRVLSSRGRTYL